MASVRNEFDRYDPIPDQELAKDMEALEDAFLDFCEVYRLVGQSLTLPGAMTRELPCVSYARKSNS